MTGIRARRADGFTLVELTVAVAILGILTSAVASALLVAMRATQEASDRLDGAMDVAALSTYFGADVHGANVIRAQGAPTCGSTGDRLVVELAGPDRQSLGATTTTVVSYVAPGAGTAVLRRACSQPAAVPDDERVVATGLSSSSEPVVSCLGLGGGPTACGGSSWASVELTVTSALGDRTVVVGTRRTT